jgi:hypothetical protein
MAEIPLIVSNLPEMSKVVKNHNIGIILKENTVKGLHEAIENASKLNLEQTKANLKAAKQINNWKAQEDVLIKLYQSL